MRSFGVIGDNNFCKLASETFVYLPYSLTPVERDHDVVYPSRRVLLCTVHLLMAARVVGCDFLGWERMAEETASHEAILLG